MRSFLYCIILVFDNYLNLFNKSTLSSNDKGLEFVVSMLSIFTYINFWPIYDGQLTGYIHVEYSYIIMFWTQGVHCPSPSIFTTFGNISNFVLLLDIFSYFFILLVTSYFLLFDNLSYLSTTFGQFILLFLLLTPFRLYLNRQHKL